MKNRFIFTVTAGRSGQNTLSNLIESHVLNSFVSFEYPQINYILGDKLSIFERKFRRSFLETHELLGRGKVLTSFVNNDYKYIEKIAKKRSDIINKKMKERHAYIHIDISKYFARGLHIGFKSVIPSFSLIHLVRDPILNMRSFLNRNKNFYLDNNSPGSDKNILVMDPCNMTSSDLYLWAWCEMALRYEDMKNNSYVDNYVEIHTNKLNDSSYMNKCLDKLEIEHLAIKKNCVRLNTNMDSGYKKTKVTKSDIEKFEKFIDKAPGFILEKIPYLNLYNPYSIHKI